MIPKIIHYCWFGRKPLPKLALKCIASWKKFLPNYEIKEWNEDNFDVNQIQYTAEAYKCKKYAFVSDYARFKIMYDYGGIYFDTDVEAIKPLDCIINKGAFWGLEKSKDGLSCNPGLGFACPPGLDICKEMINHYKSEVFILSNGKYNLTTVVEVFTKMLKDEGFTLSSFIEKLNEIHIYPPEYFSPINYLSGEKKITEKTCTIHHYAASWVNKYDNLPLYAKIWQFLHLPNTNIRGRIHDLKKKK